MHSFPLVIRWGHGPDVCHRAALLGLALGGRLFVRSHSRPAGSGDADLLQELGHPVRRLRSHLQPMLGPFRIYLHGRGIGKGIVVPDDFHKAAIAWGLRVRHYHPVARPLLGSRPPQSDSKCHLIKYLLRSVSYSTLRYYIIPGCGPLSRTKGSVKKKVLPSPGLDSTQIRPPWASTMLLQMLRPNPNPDFLPVVAS